ncbi:hypothetical protein [Pseudomonas sp. PB106]|uniref:hypothetical protein n=1 Tax=Pseudomonas sp. PB106 TaxID=2494699 RepID=UPI00131E0FDF|nr:hypothetical protein [Pseudomonas sp. PB106]KAE9643025.1 hypothetical protein EJA71_18115 [Pseudomonas sp. PB106]
MYMLALIALIVLQIFTASIALYFYSLTKKKDVEGFQPYSQFLIGGSALGFASFILFMFYVFVDDRFEIGNNLGQVGDFVGGLTNPVLSFVALIVLLRTTLIQTDEARKTSVIMLEQQRLMEEERFESTFYKLLERYESIAEVNLRIHTEKDKLSVGLRMLQDIRKKRIEFDEAELRNQIRNVKKHIKEVFVKDKLSKTMARAWKVYHFVDGSSLKFSRKKYYFSIMVDAMEPCELVLFLSSAFAVRGLAKGVKKYVPGKVIKREFYPSGLLFNYYTRRPLNAKAQAAM